MNRRGPRTKRLQYASKFLQRDLLSRLAEKVCLHSLENWQVIVQGSYE